MQNENLIPMMQKPSRISTTQQVANTHVIQIYEDIGHPDEYRDELNLINTSTEMDTIVLDICTDGGVLDTAMLFKRALFNTPAHTVAIIGPACSSAGSILALSCEEHILDDTSNLMIHTSTYGLVAKDTDIYEHANFSRKQLRKLYEDVYSGFLSESDLEDVIKGTPFYFDADQLAERLENMYEYRRANQQKGCGDPNCEQCGLDNEAEDESTEGGFDLKDLIKQAVNEALAERETVKATDKPAEGDDEQVKPTVAPKLLKRLVDNYPAYEAGKIYKVLESEMHEDGSYFLTVENDLKSQSTITTDDPSFEDKWKIFNKGLTTEHGLLTLGAMFNKQDKGGDMKFTPEQRQKIYEACMKKVDEITEECDWVTPLSPKEIINILLNIVEKGEYKDD